MADHSESVDNSSHAPSSVNDMHMPDDSLLIRFDQVDPTIFIDNPDHAFNDPFYHEKVDEPLGAALLELLSRYQELVNANINLSIQTIKKSLQDDELKNGDVYDILDKFNDDIPDVVHVNSSFLSESTLPLFLAKQTLHCDINKKLKQLSDLIGNLSNAAKAAKGKARESESDASQDDEEDEVAPPTKTKKGGKKTKKAKNQ